MNFSTAIMKENSTDMIKVNLMICDTEAFNMWNFEIKEDYGAPLAHSIWFTENFFNCFETKEEAEKKPNPGTDNLTARESIILAEYWVISQVIMR